MNRIYKTLWDARRCSCIVVDERKKSAAHRATVSGSFRSSSFKGLLLGILLFSFTNGFPDSANSSEVNNLTVASGQTYTLNADGHFQDVVVNGKLVLYNATNPIYLYTYALTVNQGGSLTSDGNYATSLHLNFTTNNYGVISVTKTASDSDNPTANIVANSAINNYATGTIHADSLIEAPSLYNYGQVDATALTTSAYLKNYEGATIQAKRVETNTLSNQAELNSDIVSASNDLSNSGENAKITSQTLLASTISENTGSITSENIEVSGSLSNENLLTATNELVAGSLTNARGAKVDVGAGTLSVTHELNNDGTVLATALNAGQIQNNSEIKANTTLTAQSIESNTGTINAPVVSVTGNVENASLLNADTSFSAGSVKNSGQISTGKMQVVDDLVNEGETASIEAKNITASTVSNNSGAISATTFNIFGAVNNSGTIKATRNFLVENLTNTVSGSISAEFIESAGAFENSGTIATDVLYTLEEGANKGEISVNEFFVKGDFSNENSGSLIISDELTVEAPLINFGTVKVDEATVVTDSLINSGTMNLTYVELEKGATFKNTGSTDSFAEMIHLVAEEGSSILADAGKVVVDSLSADTVNYYQKGGTFEVDKGWFNNSVLYVYGGTLDDSHNSTQSLGANTIYIKGETPFGSIDTDEVGSTNKGLTTVIASEVTSETTIFIQSGGILVADSIDLDGKTPYTITLESGGALQAKSHEFFDGVGGQVFYLDALDPTGTTTIETEVVGATSVGAVKDSIVTGVNIQSGGNLVISDKYYASTLIGSVLNSLAGAYENADEINVVFLGTITSEFNVDSVYQLQNEDLPDVKNPGVVLSGVTLSNTTAANGDAYSKLVVGTDEDQQDANHFSLSIGFKDIDNANEASIVNGRELALVGSAIGEDESYKDDGHKLLSDSENGGSVFVEDGTFTLGSHGTTEGTAGWVNSVALTDLGTLNVKNGEFGIWSIGNDGNVNVAGNATLHTNSLTGGGSVVNSGVLYIENRDPLSVLILADEEGEDSSESAADEGTSAQFVVSEAGFINKEGATLDATDVETTQVNGPLSNAGTAYYNDMVIASNASSNNTGYEKGQWLTVNGTHTNSGTSIWNSLTVSKDAAEDNSGTLTVEDAFAVEGSLTNSKNGVIDASTVPETQLSGSINNAGTIYYADLVIQKGSTDQNQGNESGDSLNIEEGGTHVNTGTSVWNSVTVSSNSEENNNGKLKVESEFIVGGSLTNGANGVIDATNVPETQLAGSISNEGTINYGDLAIQDGGTNNNKGFEQGGTLQIAEGGTQNNTGTSVWEKIEMSGGVLNSTGDMTADELAMNSGSLNFGEGSLKVQGDTSLNGGSIVVGNDKDLSSDNAVHVQLTPTGAIDTNIYVGNNGDLGLGNDSLSWTDSIGAPNIPQTPSRLVVTTPIETGSGGIAVGQNVYTDSGNHVDLSNGDLYFGNGSTTVIDASIMVDGSSAFTSTAEGAKVTVEDGATLVLSGITHGGNYTIAQNYSTAGNFDEEGNWVGGWIDEGNLYAIDISGISWNLTLGHTDESIYVTAVIGDIRTIYPNVAIPNIGNAMLQECTTSSSSNFVCGILRDTGLSTDEKTRILNSVANIAFAGGVLGASYGDLTTALDSIDNHLSFSSDNFNGAGYLWDADLGAKVWIDVNGGWSHSKGFSATGLSGTSFRSNNYGFVLGLDKRLENTDVVLGGAFSFNDGNLKSKGGVIGTKNSYQSYGLHLYGNWSPVSVFNLLGSLSWLHNSSDIEQAIGVADYGNATAKVQTNLVSVGVRAESALRVNESLQVIPHVEARYIWSKSGNFDTRIDGSKLWSNSTKANSVLQIPIGVAYRGDFSTNSGWSFHPNVDVAIIPQLGRSRQTTTLNYAGVSDTVDGQFMGNLGYQLKLGVMAEKGNASVGLTYGFTGGNKGRADQSARIVGRLKF